MSDDDENIMSNITTEAEERIINIEDFDVNDDDIRIERFVNMVNSYIILALNDANINNGLAKASALIKYLETIARANNTLSKTYDDEIKKFEQEINSNTTTSIFEKEKKNYEISLKKLELIMKYFFKNTKFYIPLKAGSINPFFKDENKKEY